MSEKNLVPFRFPTLPTLEDANTSQGTLVRNQVSPPPLPTLEDANTSQGTMDSGKPVEGETERLEAEAQDWPIKKYKDNLAKEKSKLEENKQGLNKLVRVEGLDNTENNRFDYLEQGILGRIGVKKAAQQRNAGNQELN